MATTVNAEDLPDGSITEFLGINVASEGVKEAASNFTPDLDDFYRSNGDGTSRGVPAASQSEGLNIVDAEHPLVAYSIAGLLGRGSDIDSAPTIIIPDDGNFFHVSDTTTITDIDWATGGRPVWLLFEDALILTHHATTLILPTGANITTAAGDVALFAIESGDNVKCLAYHRADGTSLTGSGTFTAASTTEVLTGTDTAKGVTSDALAALWEKGADIASASTISIGEGGYFHITGTVTITDIDWATTKSGRPTLLVFDGALILTHNATTLILPSAANITTAAGDACLVVSEGGDNARVIAYWPKSGKSLISLVPWTAASSSGPASLDFAEDTDNGTNKVTVKSAAALAADYTATLPSATCTILGTTDIGATQLWVPAFAITPAVTSGAEAGVLETTTNKVCINYLGFDTAADEYGIIQAMLPGRWDGGTVTARFVWMHPTTTVNFGVAWGLQGVSLADGNATDTAWGTGVVVTDTGGTAGDQLITGATGAITIASAAAGETQFLRVYRSTANAGDTMAVDARLIGVLLTFTANAIKDA